MYDIDKQHFDNFLFHGIITLLVVEKIDDVSEIDYTLLLAPIFTSSYVETNHKV